MNTHSPGSIYVARSLPAALDALNECGCADAPFAGGTWIRRSPIRHEPHKPHDVAIGKIPELTAIRPDPRGAMRTWALALDVRVRDK